MTKPKNSTELLAATTAQANETIDRLRSDLAEMTEQRDAYRKRLTQSKRSLNQAVTAGEFFLSQLEAAEATFLRLYIAIAFAFGAGFVMGLVMASA